MDRFVSYGSEFMAVFLLDELDLELPLLCHASPGAAAGVGLVLGAVQLVHTWPSLMGKGTFLAAL